MNAPKAFLHQMSKCVLILSPFYIFGVCSVELISHLVRRTIFFHYRGSVFASRVKRFGNNTLRMKPKTWHLYLLRIRSFRSKRKDWSAKGQKYVRDMFSCRLLHCYLKYKIYFSMRLPRLHLLICCTLSAVCFDLLM